MGKERAMEYKCFDVLEIHGQLYTVVEKLSYREKGGQDRWEEYGLKPGKGGGKWWLTVAEGGASCTLSQTVYVKEPPKGFRLRGRGVQAVTCADGETDASVGDVADYWEYASEKDDFCFFVEKWREDEDTPQSGQEFRASGMRISPLDIRLCTDAAALSMANALRKERQHRLLRQGAMYAVMLVGMIVFFAWSEGATWRGVRETFGFPYTMEERLADSSYYEAGETGDAAKGVQVYESSRDSATVAMELIEAIGGDVVSVVQDKEAEEARIVIRTRREACLIREVDGKTRVEIGAPGALSIEDKGARYDVEHTSRLLERYAQMVRTDAAQGRKALFPEEQAQKRAQNAQNGQ